MISKENFELLYRYLAVSDEPEKVDMIFVFGGISMPEVWHKALELYKKAFAEKIYIAGGLGKKSKTDNIETPEAETIKTFLMAHDVPSDAIIVEAMSSNTLENIVNAKKTLESARKIIAVSKPFHMRRALATFAKHHPQLKVFCYPSELVYEKLNEDEKRYYFARMLGELDRLSVYAKKGDIVSQEIPSSLVSLISPDPRF